MQGHAEDFLFASVRVRVDHVPTAPTVTEAIRLQSAVDNRAVEVIAQLPLKIKYN